MISYALNTLAAPHRAVIYRAHYLRWSTRQIAIDLEITQSVAKARLHDALRALRLTLIELAQENSGRSTKRVAG